MSPTRRTTKKAASAAPKPDEGTGAGPDDVQPDDAPEQDQEEGDADEAAPRPARNEWDLALPMGKPAPEVTRHLTKVRESDKGHVGVKPTQSSEES